MAATALAKIVGVEMGLRPGTEHWFREATALLAKEQLMIGLEESFDMLEGNLPREGKRQRVQLNVEEVLEELQAKLTRWFDVTLTKDSGNTGTDGARADVVVDGQPILGSVPATFLLFLDKRLGELHNALRKIPVQSAAEVWQPSTVRGIYRTEATRVPTTTKATEFKVVVGPTDHHPADVREVSKDVLTGTKVTVKFTSAPEQAWLADVVKRIIKLREGVQAAIYEANKAEVRDQKAGAAVFGFIFANGSK